MARGTAICVGLDVVDERHYRAGDRAWDGRLGGAERHARAVAGELVAAGFAVTMLTGQGATSTAIVDALAKCARGAESGDIAVFYFSGHGGFPELDGYRTPVLVCYDRMLFSDELHTAFARFGSGVRVVSLVDACHAGSVFYRGDEVERIRAEPDDPHAAVFPGYLDAFYAQHRAMYDAYLAAAARPPLNTEVLHFGACHERCAALDAGERGGVFTLALLDAWKSGTFTGSYRELFAAIALRTGRQVPTLMSAGPELPSFPDQRALCI